MLATLLVFSTLLLLMILKKYCLAHLASVPFSNNPCDIGNPVANLNINVGAKVMLTHDVNVTDNLNNQPMRTVTNVVLAKSNTTIPQKIDDILVTLDSQKVGQYAKVHVQSYTHFQAIFIV